MNDLSKKIKVNTDQCEGDTQKSYSPRFFKQIKPFSFTWYLSPNSSSLASIKVTYFYKQFLWESEWPLYTNCCEFFLINWDVKCN